jgi:Domain of unknown function (DUF397)
VSESWATKGVLFKISTFSDGGGCVAVGRLADGSVAVRQSKDVPNGEVLRFTNREWSAFVAGVKAGEFDTP